MNVTTPTGKRLVRLIATMPDFLCPDLHGINTLEDLITRVKTELDQRPEWNQDQRNAVLHYLDRLRQAA